MTAVTLDIDDGTLTRVIAVAQARKVSVERLLAERARDLAQLAPIALDNAGLQALLAPLQPGYDVGMSERERVNDRALAGAEVYAANRQRLLGLIDGTTGDRGRQAWDRSSLYEG